MSRVSCLMVTKPGRENLARRAIDAFNKAAWDDKELVIVSDPLEDRAIEWAGMCDFGRSRVRLVLAKHGSTLGHLRNRCLDEATGDFVIQWDDDDFYHPERISLQMAPFASNPDAACTCLTDQLYVFESMSPIEVAWVDWAMRGVDPRTQRPRSRLIPGTICARAEWAKLARYPEEGNVARRGEDGAHLQLLLTLGDGIPVVDAGWCYARSHHGANTWGATHFRSNATKMGRRGWQRDVKARDHAYQTLKLMGLDTRKIKAI